MKNNLTVNDCQLLAFEIIGLGKAIYHLTTDSFDDEQILNGSVSAYNGPMFPALAGKICESAERIKAYLESIERLPDIQRKDKEGASQE